MGSGRGVGVPFGAGRGVAGAGGGVPGPGFCVGTGRGVAGAPAPGVAAPAGAGVVAAVCTPATAGLFETDGIDEPPPPPPHAIGPKASASGSANALYGICIKLRDHGYDFDEVLVGSRSAREYWD